MLRVFLEGVDGWNAARRAAAARYRELGLDEHATLPPDGGVYHLYMTRVADRATVVEACQAAGVGCGVYYATPAPPPAGVRRPARARPAGDGGLRPRGARAADVPDAHRPRSSARCVAAVASARTTGVRVWVDLTNAPHAVVLAPLVRALAARGDEVDVTARDYGQTVASRACTASIRVVIGHHGGGGRAGKARAAAERVAALARLRARPRVRRRRSRTARPTSRWSRAPSASRRRRCSTTSTPSLQHSLNCRLAARRWCPRRSRPAALARYGAPAAGSSATRG